MAILQKGGGDRGIQINIGLVPDSTFKLEIDALIAAGEKVIGKVIKLATGANYQCTSPADTETANGRIIDYRPTATSYVLTVELWSYTNAAGVVMPATRIINAEYTTTPALGDMVVVEGSTYRSLTDGESTGGGFVIALDVPGTGFFDFIQ